MRNTPSLRLDPPLPSSAHLNRDGLRWGRVVGMLVLTLLIAAPVMAQPQSTESGEPQGIYADFLVLDGAIADKVESLGRAIPESRYDWRPTEGVRSVGEVLKHLAETNFQLVAGAGSSLPEAVPANWAEVRDKETILRLTALSFQMLHGAARSLASLDPSEPLPGNEGPHLGLLVFANTTHHAEHLGQLVAYARSVGVTPPWSR